MACERCSASSRVAPREHAHFVSRTACCRRTLSRPLARKRTPQSSAVRGLLRQHFTPSREGAKKDSTKILFAIGVLAWNLCSGFPWIPGAAFHETNPVVPQNRHERTDLRVAHDSPGAPSVPPPGVEPSRKPDGYLINTARLAGSTENGRSDVAVSDATLPDAIGESGGASSRAGCDSAGLRRSTATRSPAAGSGVQSVLRRRGRSDLGSDRGRRPRRPSPLPMRVPAGSVPKLSPPTG